MARKVKIGDVVKLRSGGPEMTVESLAGEPNAYSPLHDGTGSVTPSNCIGVVWFDGHGVGPLRGFFPPQALAGYPDVDE